jgi:hypothetical protein
MYKEKSPFTHIKSGDNFSTSTQLNKEAFAHHFLSTFNFSSPYVLQVFLRVTFPTLQTSLQFLTKMPNRQSNFLSRWGKTIWNNLLFLFLGATHIESRASRSAPTTAAPTPIGSRAVSDSV